ncbi:MAG TPA: hypothetical protein VIT67_19055 [Povalibacter sp.]
MTPSLSNERELYVAPGGPSYRFLQRISRTDKGVRSVVRRIIVLLLITWVPMCVLAIVQGFALGETPRESFLLDFATYARFFVGIPILVFAENIIGARLRQAGLQFVRDGIVGTEDYPVFERAIAGLAQRRESVVATLVIAALAVFGAWNLTFESARGVAGVGWQSVVLPEGHASRYSLAGIWNHVVAVPVLLFLWYRWLWRILFWTLFLRDVAKLNLRLVPTHADSAGGLSFLADAHTSFGTLAFAVGSVFSAQAAFQVIYEGASLKVFQTPVIVVLLAIEVLFLGPLLVFSPTMGRIRRSALKSYGSLLVRYSRGFQEKWIDSPSPPDEQLLGSSDIQSLTDMGASFRLIKEMGLTPFGRRAIIHLAVATFLPSLPLLLLVVPIEEIIQVVAKVVN